MYSREFPTGGNFLFFIVCMMSLFRLPCSKLAFAQRSGAMKAPVGLLSDRTVLRKQDGGASPRQVTAGLPRCSSRQEWPGRMPVPDVRWLHRGKGKDLWIFSSCSNAHSSDRPTAAKAGGKIRIPFHIRRKGAEVFCPALAFGGFIDGLQVPVVMRSFQLLRCFQKESAPCRLPTHSGSGLAAAWHSGELSAFLGQTGSSGYF